MEIKDYVQEAVKTDKEHFPLPREAAAKVDNALGLAGEAGEVVDLVKHAVFHQEGIDKFKLTKEIGDVLWYLVHVARDHDIPMEVVMAVNIEKLAQRYPNGYCDAASADRRKIEANEHLRRFYAQKMHENNKQPV